MSNEQQKGQAEVVETPTSEKKPKSVFSKILKIFGYIILIWFGAYIIVNAFWPNSTINIFGYKHYIVESESMVDLYNVGDVIFVTKSDQEDIKEGDVITFEAYGILPYTNEDGEHLIGKNIWSHHVGEVVELDGEIYFKTMPHQDGNWDKHLAFEAGEATSDGVYDIWFTSIDEDREMTSLLPYDQVIGEVRFAIPWIGHIALFFSNTLRLDDPIMVGLLAVNIIILYLIIKIIVDEVKERKAVTANNNDEAAANDNPAEESGDEVVQSAENPPNNEE